MRPRLSQANSYSNPSHWGAPDQDMQTTDPGLCALSEDFKFPRPSTPNDDMHHIEGDG